MKKQWLLGVAFLAAGAQAEQFDYYAGAGLGIWNFTEKSHNKVFNVSSLEVQGGLTFWNWLSLEGRLGAGVEGSTELTGYKENGNTLPQNTELTLDNYASLYVKPELRNDIAKLYALLGFSSVSSSTESTKLDSASTKNGSNSNTISGLSFGVGMGFQMSEAAVINLEYVRLVQDSGFRYNGYNVGFNYRF